MLIELNFHKIAEDTRPEAGYWAKQMAINRATREPNSIFLDKELRSINSKHLALSALFGALPGIGMYKTLTHQVYKPLSAIAGTGAGLAVGSIPATAILKKDLEDYFAKKGIKYNVWTGVPDMNDEAKRKYLSKKYRGGGYA